jgi:hypothetical protein
MPKPWQPLNVLIAWRTGASISGVMCAGDLEKICAAEELFSASAS